MNTKNTTDNTIRSADDHRKQWDRVANGPVEVQRRVANAVDLDAKALATRNNELLRAQEQSGASMTASDAREFDRNCNELEALNTLAGEWNTVTRKPAAYTQDSTGPGANRVLDESADGFVIGAHRGFAANAIDLAELHYAATNRGVKNITLADAPMSGTPDYDMTVFPALRDKMRLLDYLPTKDTMATTTTYFRATTAADQAGAVAPGGIKPESSPVWEEVTSTVGKVAHWGKVHDEVLADFSGFLQVVSEEFIAGLIDGETDQLLNGSGIAPNLRGLLNTVGIQTQAFSTNIIETAAKAQTKLLTGSSKVRPDVFVFNPTDWERITLFRVGGSTTTDGPFLSNPLDAPAFELWNTPVVVTNRIAAGTAVCANLKTAARARIRQRPTVEVAPGTGEVEWKTNLTLIRAEERLALEVIRPAAICTIVTTGV